MSRQTSIDAAAQALDAARAELAPTGRLRAGMNLANTLFTTRDAATGELQGVAVDLMRELASRLGLPLELVVHATPGEVADSVDQGTWDVAILAIEASRAKKIAFSPALTEIEATYAVHCDSSLRSADQVDATGVRISVQDKAGYELYLTRTLRHASLLRASPQESLNAFVQGRADALAGLKPMLLASMHLLPDARLLEGYFMVVNHGLSTALGHPAALAFLKQFAGDVTACGLVARSIERHQVQGLVAVK